MRHGLILANQTLTTNVLHRAVQERVDDEPHEFFVVAPATPADDGIEGSGGHAEAPSAADRIAV